MDNTKTRRTDTEILKELIDVLIKYNDDRDAEWEFAIEHGITGDSRLDSDDEIEEHEQILDDIQKNRNRIQDLIREAIGIENFSL